MEEISVFKVLSTLAIFLWGTVWAFRNIRSINDWVSIQTGIGRTSDGMKSDRTSNTNSSNTAE